MKILMVSQIISLKRPFIALVIITAVVTSTLISLPANAWTSDWIIWEDPDPILYYIDYYDSANTKAAYNSAIGHWESAQSKADFYNNPAGYDLFLSYAYSSGVGWAGYTYIEADENYYITYATCYLNEYYTDNYSTHNERCNVSGHELGHSLGLGEETGAVLMNDDHSIGWGVYGINTPQQDDINGVNTLY